MSKRSTLFHLEIGVYMYTNTYIHIYIYIYIYLTKDCIQIIYKEPLLLSNETNKQNPQFKNGQKDLNRHVTKENKQPIGTWHVAQHL